MAGPIWSNPIYDTEFVDFVLEFVKSEQGQKLGTYNRILGILSVVQEELHDIPLYYTIDHLCMTLKLETVPQLKFRSAILHEGYRVSHSHAMKNSIKTDAPISLIWDILRFWSKSHPVNETRLKENPVIKAILSKEPSKDYDFETLHPNATPQSRKDSLVRYQENPAANWGPGTRSTLMIDANKMTKSVRNQNKNKNKRQKVHNQSSDDSTSRITKQLKVEASV
jgi:tRNA (guanine26-N2/guanine27-N2)-dimethyltransferase